MNIPIFSNHWGIITKYQLKILKCCYKNQHIENLNKKKIISEKVKLVFSYPEFETQLSRQEVSSAL